MNESEKIQKLAEDAAPKWWEELIKITLPVVSAPIVAAQMGRQKVLSDEINNAEENQKKADEDKKTKAEEAFDVMYGGMPIITKDSSGKRVVKDADDYKEAFVNAQVSGDPTVYVNSDGTITNSPKVSMTFKDGKINISAPKEIQESDWFKEQFKGDTFKSLATLYANNPKGDYEVEYERFNEDTKSYEKATSSINTLLKDYASNFEENSQKYHDSYMATRHLWNRMSNGEIALTDKEITRIYEAQNINFDNSHESTTKTVEIPKYADKYFKNEDGSYVEGYNPETGEMSAKDFYKWYSIASDKGKMDGKDAAKAMNELSYGLQSHMSSLMNDIIISGSSEEKTDELIKTYSLMKVMQHDQPHIDFFNGVNYFFESAFLGFETMTANVVNGTWQMMPYGAAAVYTMNPNLRYSLGTAVLVSLACKSFEAGGIEQVKKDLGDIVGISYGLGEHNYFNQATESKQGSWKQMTDLSEETLRYIDERSSELANVYYASNAGYFIGNLIGSLPEAVAVNGFGAMAASAVGAHLGIATITSAAESSLSLSSMTTSMKILDLCGKAGLWSVNVLTQGVVDTLFQNGDKIAALFDGATKKEQKEFWEALTGNVTWNGAFELIGVGKNAFLQRTRPGQVIEAKFRQLTNRIGIARNTLSVKRGEKLDAAEIKIREATRTTTDSMYNTKIKNEQARDLKKLIIDQQKAISKTKVFTNPDGTMAGVKEIQNLTNQRVRAEVEYDRFRRNGSMAKVSETIDKAGLTKLSNTLADTELKISKLEGVEQNVYTASRGTFSYKTDDYIDWMYSKQLLENRKVFLEGQGKTLSSQDVVTLKTLNERIDSVNKVTSKEYQNLCKQYLDNSQKWWANLMDYLASDRGGNLITAEELAGWRSNNQWGEDGRQFMKRFGANQLNDKETYSIIVDMMNKYKESGVDYISKTKTEVSTESMETINPDTQYLSQHYVRAMYLQSVARAQLASDFGDAIVNMSGVSAKKLGDNLTMVKSTGKMVTSRDNMYKILNEALNKLDTSQVGKTAYYKAIVNKNGSKAYYRNLAKGEKAIISNYLKDATPRRLKSFSKTLSLEDVNSLKQKFFIPEYTKFDTAADFMDFYKGLNDYDKGIIKKSLNTKKPTFTAYNKAIKNTDLSSQLTKAYIYSNDAILESDTFKNMFVDSQIAKLSFEDQTILKSAQTRYDKFIEKTKKASTKEKQKVIDEKLKEELKQEYSRELESFTDEIVGYADEELAKNPYFKNVVDQYEKAGVNPESAREFAVLDYYHQNKSKIRDNAKDYFSHESRNKIGLNDNKKGANYAKNFADDVEKIIDQRWRLLGGELVSDGESIAINRDALIKEAEDCMKDITGKIENGSIIEVLEKDTGLYSYWEVPEYIGALYTYSPAIAKDNIIVRFLSRGNKLARIGQLILNKGSLVTQGFRDTIGAWLGGGMSWMWTKNASAGELANVMKEADIEALQKELAGSTWNEMTAKATKTAAEKGIDYNEALKLTLAERETGELVERAYSKESMSRGAQYRSVNAEQKEVRSAIFGGDAFGKKIPNRQEWGQARKYWQKASDTASGAIKKVADKADLHEMRESFLRKSVYRHNITKGVSQGMTMDQARYYAEFAMNNATTNFGRALGWGNSIAKTIPYFGAAVNGAESFYRLVEVDPLGVSQRFVTGLAVPMMGLTAMSLQDDTDAEIYRNIPEYDKENSIVFVTGGQVYSIPVPQELSAWLAPWRIFVEKAKGGNPNLDWGELSMSALLSLPTIDLSAIMALDEKKIYGDVSFGDRISNLSSSLISQLSPAVVKTAYIGVTGTDPYTGRIYGKMKVYQDEEGNYQYESLAENEFVNNLANAFNDWGQPQNAQIMEACIDSLLGKGLTDIIEDVQQLLDVTSGQKELSEAISDIGDRAVNRVSGPVTATARTDEDVANIAWWNLTRDLKEKQKELQQPGGILETIDTNQQRAKSEEEKNKYRSQYGSAINEYQKEVLSTVKNYQNLYPTAFNTSKFNGTISLLNMYHYSGMIRDFEDQKSASGLFYSNRDLALQTLYEQGFTSPKDTSVFGYMVRDDQGNVSVKYYDPLVVSFTSTNVQYANNSIRSDIMASIEYDNIKSNYNETIKPKIDEFYKKNQHTNAEYKEFSKTLEAWDKEVMKTIVDRVGLDNLGKVLNDSQVIDILDNYIRVPSDYQTNKYGKYYSAPRLNKQRGYAQDYIKFVYNELVKESKK